MHPHRHIRAGLTRQGGLPIEVAVDSAIALLLGPR
jgi:hypothetical protein